MIFKNTALVISLLSLLLFVGCNGASTPAEQEKAADKAMADENYQKAFELYQELLEWKGEGEVAEGKRFKAALESVKCQVQLELFEEAKDSFFALEKNFPKEMAKPDSFKHALAVTNEMERANAPVLIMTDIIGYAKEKYPEVGSKFDNYKVNLVKRAETDEEKAALRKLGYL